MDNEMLIIKKTDLKELLEQFKVFNENFTKLNFNKEEVFYTRREVQKHYNLSERATIKIFTKLLKEKVIDIGKEQRLAKEHIDNLLKEGVILK